MSILAAKGKMRYPEIENGLISANHLRREIQETLATSIDLLEIPQDPLAETIWLEGLDHGALLKHFESDKAALQEHSRPSLQVFFLNVDKEQNVVLVHPSTFEWLQARFGTSLSYIDQVMTSLLWTKVGNACLSCDDAGKTVGIEIIYRVSPVGVNQQIWFFFDFVTDSAVYFISSCNYDAKKRILQCAIGPDRDLQALRRPLVIDAFLADESVRQYSSSLEKLRRLVLDYQRPGASEVSPNAIQQDFDNLHDLSWHWHMIHEDLTDLEDRTQFLINLWEKYFSTHCRQSLEVSTADSLSFIKNRIYCWKHWISNYQKLTNIRINLFFNLASQADSRTNLDIARNLKAIAEETRKDSSSMITIATLTMFFLPGTFVSGLFNTVFFTTKADGNGNLQLTMAPYIWYFPTIALPLTIIVFLTWVFWQRRRGMARDVESNIISDDQRADGVRANRWCNLEMLYRPLEVDGKCNMLV